MEEEVSRLLEIKADRLATVGTLNRAQSEFIKIAMLISTGASVFALGNISWAGIPLVTSLGLYAGALIDEKYKTGRLRPTPLPFTAGDIIDSIAQVEEGGGPRRELKSFDYLSQGQKAEYYLATQFRGEMVQALAPLTNSDRYALWDQATNVLEDLYGDNFQQGQSFFYHADPGITAKISTKLTGRSVEKPTTRRVIKEAKISQGPPLIVPSVRVEEDPWEPPTIASVDPTIRETLEQAWADDDDNDALETLDALKRYVQTPRNLFVVATGGSGKGLTLANLCRWRSEADDKFTALWVDPKNLKEESGYFDHPSITPYRFSAPLLSPQEIAEEMRTVLHRFQTMCATLPPKSPAWLILDEWYFIHGLLAANDKDTLKEVEGTIRAVVSLLDANHKHIVIVGQSPKIDDVLEKGGGLLANLPTLSLFKRDDNGIKLLEKCGQCGVMPRRLTKSTELYKVCDRSPRDRAVYFDGKLWPMPELENPSGYDRDKQTFINGYQ